MASWNAVRFSHLSDDYRFDSDYYQPEYLRQDAMLSRLNVDPLHVLATVADGNHLSIAEKFCSDGVRYLRGQDLSDFFISENDPIFVPESEYNILARSHMNVDDVLVGVVGTIGAVSLVTSRFKKLTGNCKIAILRKIGNTPAEAIAAYLASPVGQSQMKRRIRGSVQPGLILPDLKKIPVPRISSQAIRRIKTLIEEAEEQNNNALRLYPEAEQELLDHIGWSKLVAKSPELSYGRPVKAFWEEGRCDAEFFQPMYLRLRRQLEKIGATPLGELWSSCDKGFQPEDYSDKGKVVVVKSKNVSQRGINLAACERTPDPEADGAISARLSCGDLVVNSTGRGTLGRASIMPRSSEKVIAAVDLLICHLLPNEVVPEYVALFLNSPAGLAQTEQQQVGSSGQLHIYPNHLGQILIYTPTLGSGKPDLRFQEKLAAKIEETRKARDMAVQKVQEAIGLVEAEVS